jgi:AmiR/NasT family two-component response regulator
MDKEQKEIRVLVVEDDHLVSEMVRGTLEEVGYLVVGEAIDGREALEMVARLSPDVVLMDIKMPDMDGIAATRQIMEANPVPVVALTAYENPELMREAVDAGLGAYLVKPSTAREMERAITVAMARFDDIVELRRLNAKLNETLATVKQLSGLLPICASCNMIRDEGGRWQQLENYICEHSEAEFSHSLCPECFKKFYPEYYRGDKK